MLHTWLEEHKPDFRQQVQVVTMDDFTGYATAVDQERPHTPTVMEPLHLVHLAAGKLTCCRLRRNRETTGRRGHKDDPLYMNRQGLHVSTNYLTPRKK